MVQEGEEVMAKGIRITKPIDPKNPKSGKIHCGICGKGFKDNKTTVKHQRKDHGAKI